MSKHSASQSSLPANVESRLLALLRTIRDFPKPGINFIDITPLLADADGLGLAVRALAEPFRKERIDLVVGAESRGFIFGAAVARELNCGFIPVRKPGKLPHKTIAQEYELEYGKDKIEIHADAIRPGQRILMVDDLLATGGTMKAACQMVEKLQGQIIGITFLIELALLKGRRLLPDYNIHCLISYNQ